MPPVQLNYLAAAVAAVGTFLVGALWYSPLLFGKLWASTHGYTPEKMAELRKTAPRAYLISFACYFVMALAFSAVLSMAGVTGAGGGAAMGVVLWLGFAFTLGLTANMFSDLPVSTFAIDAGYQLAYLVLMGVVLAGWGG